MKNAVRIARNSLYEVTAIAAKGLAMLVVYLLLGRLSGSAALGDLATLLTLIVLFTSLATFGIPELLTREIARNKDRPEAIHGLMRSGSRAVALLSLAAIVLLLISGEVLSLLAVHPWGFAWAGAAILLESLAILYATPFRGHEVMRLSALTTIVMELSFLAFAVPCLFLLPGIDSLLFAYALSRLLCLAVAFGLNRVHLAWQASPPTRENGVSLLKTAFPFALHVFFSYFSVRANIIVLAYLAGSAAVGVFEAAASLAVRANLLARVINMAVYPFLSNQFLKGEAVFHRYTSETIHLLALPGFFLAAVCVLFGPEVIALLYGKTFLAAGTILQVLAIIIPLRFISNTLATALMSSNRQAKRSLAIIVAALFNVGLNVLLIPRYGIQGAALASVASELTLFLLLLASLRPDARSIVAPRSFLAPLAGASVMASIVLTMKSLLSTIPLAAVACCGYVLVAALIDRPAFRFFGNLLFRHLLRRGTHAG